jgi:hypothetical protein
MPNPTKKPISSLCDLSNATIGTKLEKKKRIRRTRRRATRKKKKKNLYMVGPKFH